MIGVSLAEVPKNPELISNNFQAQWRFKCPKDTKMALFFHDGSWFAAFDGDIKISAPISQEILIPSASLIKNKELTIVQFTIPPFVGLIPAKVEAGWDIRFTFHDISQLPDYPIMPSPYVVTPTKIQSYSPVSSKLKIFEFQNKEIIILIVPSDQIGSGPYLKKEGLCSLLSPQGMAFQVNDSSILKTNKDGHLLIQDKLKDLELSPFYFANYPNLETAYEEFCASLKKSILPYSKKNSLIYAWFLVTKGQGVEALAILNSLAHRFPESLSEETYQKILGMAYFVNSSYLNALNSWSIIEKPSFEVQLWRLCARSALGHLEGFLEESKNIQTMILAYPKPLQEVFINTLLPLWTAVKDLYNLEYFCAFSLTKGYYPIFLQILSRAYHENMRLYYGKITFESASKIFKELSKASHNHHFVSSMASFLCLVHDVQKSRISLKEAIPILDRLRFSWRGDSLEYRMTMKLIEWLLKERDFVRVLKLMENLHQKYSVRAAIDCMGDRMADLLKEFLNQGTNGLKVITAYDTFRYLIKEGMLENEIALRVVKKLEDMDLLEAAADLLSKIALHESDRFKKNQLMLQVATIQVWDSRFSSAITNLDNLSLPLTPEQNQKKLSLKAQSLEGLKKVKEAQMLLQSSSNPDHLIMLSNSFIKEKKWTEAYESLIYLQKILPIKHPYLSSVELNLAMVSYMANKKPIIKGSSHLEKYIDQQATLKLPPENRLDLVKVLENSHNLEKLFNINRDSNFFGVLEGAEISSVQASKANTMQSQRSPL